MPRMIDLVRKSQMSANMMHAAARGALLVGPGEMIEILVHLSLHNKVFADQARMTLAGWDEKASQQVAADPATSKEVLEYLISPRNIRPALLPALLENPSISEDVLSELAASGSRTVVEGMLLSQRITSSPVLLDALKSNPRLRAHELATIGQPDAKAVVDAVPDGPAMKVEASDAVAPAAEDLTTPPVEEASAPEPSPLSSAAEAGDDEEVLSQAIAYYLQENAAELAASPDKPFEPVKVTLVESTAEAPAEVEPAAEAAAAAKPAAAAPAGVKSVKKPGAPAGEERRDSTLQKIAKLDIKGRIALAMRGSKEERSILIRDGTKLVALAVLDSPKVSDGEVEGFALQKNVLESVLRAIPLKRRFAKNYSIMRNLVYNPRTPLDLSLGLMKNLLIHDLKNLSGNKEVAETIRKLALRMFKQKTEKKKE